MKSTFNFGELDIPLELIQAQAEGKLVVFAGAGVSMTAGLPSFEGLVKKIAENAIDPINNSVFNFKRKPKNPMEELFKKGQYDHLLGQLKNNGVEVHKISAQILNIGQDENTVSPAHETIKALFPVGELKIITTNFDPLFEANVNPEAIYVAPSLPNGANFTGLVYLHGNLKNPQGCVLTDEDFGNAYFSGGWAREFLSKVFSTYTILFIGYSLNDILVH